MPSKLHVNRSGNIATTRKGCGQHLSETGDDDYFCMVIGGLQCKSAEMSKAYPGAAWKFCSPQGGKPVLSQQGQNHGSDDPHTNHRPGTFRPRLRGSVSFGGLGLTINLGTPSTSPKKKMSQEEACTCSSNGISGDQETNYRYKWLLHELARIHASVLVALSNEVTYQQSI